MPAMKEDYRYGEGRVSSVVEALISWTHWLPGMGKRLDGDGEDLTDGYHPEYLDGDKHVGRISRAADGRFILESLRNSLASHSSSSDDGGFLSRRNGVIQTLQRASWRRPLLTYPSELSLRSDGTGQSNLHEHNIIRYLQGRSPSPFATPTSSVLDRRRHSPGSSVLRRAPGYENFNRLPENVSPPTYFHRIPQIPVIYSPSFAPPISYHVSYPPPHTPSRTVISSSPVTPWSPVFNFSDLSSVPIPSSAERSYPSTFTPPSYMQLKTVHERYSQELPSLNAIHEEHSRWKGAYFVPVQPSPPRIKIPQQWNEYRRSRLPPRHARHARSAPELTRHDDSVTPGLLMETSPESRSSSSGFGSKNTSSQQNQSSQSGSTSEWRLPPYRPPPHPSKTRIIPYYPHPLTPQSTDLQPPYIIGEWLDFTPGQEASPHDASVDGHYEFDTVFPSTPTPPITTTSLPSFPRQRLISLPEDPPSTRTKRIISKHDNIEARVQAMKEEFHQFKKRQEKRRQTEEVESLC